MDRAAAAPDGVPPMMAAGGAAAIAQLLREAIGAGRYARGQRLPAERHLAQHFGSSRSTVREALRQLEEQRLVERRAGSGTFVVPQGGGAAAAGEELIADVTSPLELIEVRMAVEPHIARLAVLHATARDLERLGAALAAVVAGEADPASFSAADERFHLALAECTHNPLMVWLYGQINNVRTHTQWEGMRNIVLTPANMRLYNGQHAAIVEAIRRRDANGAADAVAAQMEKARDDLVGAQSR